MAAYVIADVDVHDAAQYDEYRKQVKATIDQYGGRFLVRGGAHEILEGEGVVHRAVVLEFPSMEALRRWYRSPEYAPLIALRQKASKGFLFAVDGA